MGIFWFGYFSIFFAKEQGQIGSVVPYWTMRFAQIPMLKICVGYIDHFHGKRFIEQTCCL